MGDGALAGATVMVVEPVHARPCLKQGLARNGGEAGWAVPTSLDQLFFLVQLGPKQQHQSINQPTRPPTQPDSGL